MRHGSSSQGGTGVANTIQASGALGDLPLQGTRSFELQRHHNGVREACTLASLHSNDGQMLFRGHLSHWRCLRGQRLENLVGKTEQRGRGISISSIPWHRPQDRDNGGEYLGEKLQDQIRRLLLR